MFRMIGVLVALAVPATAGADTAGDMGTLVAQAIAHQSPGARHVGSSCTDHETRTVCRVHWTNHHRRYSGRLAVETSILPAVTVYHYRLRATGRRHHHRATHMHRRGHFAVAILPGSTRDNPIPLGQPATVGPWTITVTSVTPDGIAEVMAANPYNDQPAPGHQYLIAHLAATYNGPGSSSLGGNYAIAAVGQTAVGYDNDTCADLEGFALDEYADVFTGGAVQGDVCWEIDSRDAGSLVMYVTDRLSPSVYFALR